MSKKPELVLLQPIKSDVVFGPAGGRKTWEQPPRTSDTTPIYSDTERLEHTPPDMSDAYPNRQEAQNTMICHAPSKMRLFWGPLLVRVLQKPVTRFPCHHDTGRLNEAPPDMSRTMQNVQEACDPAPSSMMLFGGPRKKLQARGLQKQVTHHTCHHDTAPGLGTS